VQVTNGQPSYGFYREGIADRDYSVDKIVSLLEQAPAPGIFHTGSLLLIPPEHTKILAIIKAARDLGWTVSVDINLRPQVASELQPYLQAIREIMTLTDWLKASDEDLKTLGYLQVEINESARLINDLRAQAPSNALSRIALTFGEQGAYLDIAGHYCRLPVPPVAVVDTVGAGDTFWGNTLADWSLHSQPAIERLATTLDGAMKAAAINCMRSSCQPPTWTEVQNYTWPTTVFGN
jgi:fructokinase